MALGEWSFCKPLAGVSVTSSANLMSGDLYNGVRPSLEEVRSSACRGAIARCRRVARLGAGGRGRRLLQYEVDRLEEALHRRLVLAGDPSLEIGYRNAEVARELFLSSRELRCLLHRPAIDAGRHSCSSQCWSSAGCWRSAACRAIAQCTTSGKILCAPLNRYRRRAPRRAARHPLRRERCRAAAARCRRSSA